MEFRQLGYFMHLAGTGSVSQSAKVLGLSQPSLSRQIQQLEDTLQVSLFERHHRPMTLTDAGEFLYRHVKQPLHELEQAMALTRRFGEGRQHRLVIGSVVSVLYGLLPEVISQLRQNLDVHPDFDIKVIEMSFAQQIAALKSGEIDVGFGRFACQDSLVEQTFLRHEPFVLAVPKWHPLAKLTEPVSLSMLNNDTLILYHKTPNPVGNLAETDPLLQLFEQTQTQPKNSIRVRDIQVALAMVAASEGFTIVPDSLKTVRTEQICYLPLAHDFTSPMYISTLAHNPIPHIDALHRAILSVYERHGISAPKPLMAKFAD
ncbi:LysR family transcriptional regulator [Moraxella sp. FZFQ2102]|uniref:LysR family transcriptional regulator n=1 Tax=Moraxella sp. FZFQ2102 TaxID=2953752 RepID=UPI00209C3327|nr:LysR family transcriptional regulator [Moraxella sp. FZFQ2102]USZ15764.1 LysR family transcriptional regulator [Moraxella sp. FZFQ2102]